MKKKLTASFPALLRRVFFALTAISIFLTGTASAEAEPGIKRHHKESLVSLTENGLFSIELLIEGKDLREGINEAELIIYDKSGNDVEDALITVIPSMKETGEASVEEAVVMEMGGGFYNINNIVIDAAGHWELTIIVHKYTLEDKAVFDFPEEKKVAEEEQAAPADQLEEKEIKEKETVLSAGDHQKYRSVLKYLPALPPIPADNSITPDKVRLGKMLFWDRRLSKTGATSCVFCHHPSYYGAEPMRKSVGIGGDVHQRNAQTVLNAAFLNTLFWAGESPSLEHQALSAVRSHVAMRSIPDEAAKRLNRIAEYKELSINVFSEPLTEENMGKAMAAYMRTLTTPDYPLARWLQGDESALTDSQKNGMVLFVDKGCISCHSGPAFSIAGAHEITQSAEDHRKEGSPAHYLHKVILPGAEKDLGRANKTDKEDDRYLFKVPSLLNVAMTPPYTHAGLIDSLRDMVVFMSENMLNIELSSREAADITAFLQSLTGKLPQEFMTAPALPAGGEKGDFGPEFMSKGAEEQKSDEVQKSNSAEVQKVIDMQKSDSTEMQKDAEERANIEEKESAEQ